jgi:hypothetical protein
VFRWDVGGRGVGERGSDEECMEEPFWRVGDGGGLVMRLIVSLRDGRRWVSSRGILPRALWRFGVDSTLMGSLIANEVKSTDGSGTDPSDTLLCFGVDVCGGP